MEMYYRFSLRKSLMINQFNLAEHKKLKKNILENNEQSNSESNRQLYIMQENESKSNEDINFNDKKDNTSNKINISDKDKEFKENNEFDEVIKDNNGFILELYRNPFLIGIKESIRFSLNIPEHLNEKSVSINNNNRETFSGNNQNNFKFQNSFGNEKNLHKLDNIFEMSKEDEDNFYIH